MDERDVWFEWLASTRHGGVAEYAALQQPQITAIRDTVITGAELHPNSRVIDVGCGDGLVGLEVLRRLSGSHVIFSDISPALLARTREEVEKLGALPRSEFAEHNAESLSSVENGSVDAVLVRAVLAYVRDRGAAVREFRRILRPSGRISLADPIFQDKAFFTAGLGERLRTGQPNRIAEFMHRILSAQFPSTLAEIEQSPVVNYNERSLLSLFEAHGFVNLRLRLHIDVVAAPPMPWRAFLGGAPRAGVPTVGHVLETRFSDDERTEFEEIFRAPIESGALAERNVNAYLTAEAPAAAEA